MADNRNFVNKFANQGGGDIFVEDAKLSEISTKTAIASEGVMLKGTDGAYYEIDKASLSEVIRAELGAILADNSKNNGTSVGKVPTLNSSGNALGASSVADLASVLGATLMRKTRLTDFDLSVLKQAVADQNLEKYGLKVGDYKTINGHDYIIAGLNCMRGSHIKTCTSDHVGLIVFPHANNPWNASGNTYEGADNRGGGYKNSDLHYYLENTLLPLVETDLGAANLLGHDKLLGNAVTEGKTSNTEWESNCKICALSEIQVYGCQITGASVNDIGEADQQLEVFQRFKHTVIFDNEYIWLRDVAGPIRAAFASNNGYADCNPPNYNGPVAALVLFN